MVTPIRFSGMASGLDTDSIISQLMKVERMPLDKLAQQKQKLAWKREAYRDMNSSLTAIQTAVNKLRFSASFNKQTAASSSTSVIDATATSSAVGGSYSVKVEQLATSAMVMGTSVSISDLKSKVGVTSTEKFAIEGPQGTINVEITPDSTYESVMKQVNSSNKGVSMSYDSINKRFMLTTTSTGESSGIQVTNPDGNSISKDFFGLDAMAAAKTGTNASVVLNGTTMKLENNSFEFNGVRFNLKGVSTTEVSVTVTRDTGTIVESIKDFVNQYNSLVDKIRAATTSVPNRNYAPLTDEQKEVMSEKQIELWESKAKTGLLYRDSILQDTLSSVRSKLVGGVEGLTDDYDSLSDIGITFQKYVKGATSQLGKLEIDEQKLQDAVSKDPDAVMNLFTKTSSLKPDDKGYTESTGYAERVYNALSTGINRIIKQIGTTTISDSADNSLFGQQFRDINKKMQTLEDRIQTVEDRYYKQFTAMEQALQKLNSQGSWLSQQLGQ